MSITVFLVGRGLCSFFPAWIWGLGSRGKARTSACMCCLLYCGISRRPWRSCCCFFFEPIADGGKSSEAKFSTLSSRLFSCPAPRQGCERALSLFARTSMPCAMSIKSFSFSWMNVHACRAVGKVRSAFSKVRECR